MRGNGDNTFRIVNLSTDFENNQSGIEYSQKRHYRIGQFGWSAVSPMVSVGYRF